MLRIPVPPMRTIAISSARPPLSTLLGPEFDGSPQKGKSSGSDGFRSHRICRGEANCFFYERIKDPLNAETAPSLKLMPQ